MPQIPKTGHVVKRSKITPARLKAWEAAIKKGGYKGYTDFNEAAGDLLAKQVLGEKEFAKFSKKL